MTTINQVAGDESVTVTVKYGKSYEDTWAVFRAPSNERLGALVGNYFGVDPEMVVGLTNHELVLNMTNVAHGSADAAALLGGVVIPASEAGVSETAQTTGGNPWAGLDENAGQDEKDWPADPAKDEEEERLLSLVSASTTVTDLQKEVWVKNRSGFDKYPSVQAAYKARGKELSK